MFVRVVLVFPESLLAITIFASSEITENISFRSHFILPSLGTTQREIWVSLYRKLMAQIINLGSQTLPMCKNEAENWKCLNICFSAEIQE